MANGLFAWYKLSGGVTFRLFSRSRNTGLSIAELLVASALLAMVLVTVMTLFGQLLRNTQKNALLSAGSFFAEKVLTRDVTAARENFFNLSRAATSQKNRFVPFDLPGFSDASGNYSKEGEGFISVADQTNKTKYLYRVEATKIDGDPDEQGQIWKVKAEVRWWQDSMSGAAVARAGSGNQSLTLERIVYFGVSN
mgnify:CR=1 FL=1